MFSYGFNCIKIRLSIPIVPNLPPPPGIGEAIFLIVYPGIGHKSTPMAFERLSDFILTESVLRIRENFANKGEKLSISNLNV